MGNCQCDKEKEDEIDKYIQEKHQTQVKIDNSNYELAKQDFKVKNLKPIHD